MTQTNKQTAEVVYVPISKQEFFKTEDKGQLVAGRRTADGEVVWLKPLPLEEIKQPAPGAGWKDEVKKAHEEISQEMAEIIRQQSQPGGREVESSQKIIVNIEGPLPVSEDCEDGYMASIEGMPGMLEVGKTRREAFDQLMISLKVKIAYDNKLKD